MKFVFLFPIPEIMDFEIETYKYSGKQELESFRQRYKNVLNQCIDLRYRRQGFQIYYVVFKGHPVSDVVRIRPGDEIIELGIDLKTHCNIKPDETQNFILYPDADFILNQLGYIRAIRIAGFHMWDCVDRLARRAHEKGLDTLVDEDLTEFFRSRFEDKDFIRDRYPGFNPRKYMDSEMFKVFMEARKTRHWLWQDY